MEFAPRTKVDYPLWQHDSTAPRYDLAWFARRFAWRYTGGTKPSTERRHRPIWEELERTLVQHGVQTYSIYLDPETSNLFGYVEVEDEARWAAIARTDVCRRWWRYMREIMPANADDSPVARELREVFHTSKLDLARTSKLDNEAR